MQPPKHRCYFVLDAELSDDGRWIVATFACGACSRETLIIYRGDTPSIPCPHCHPEKTRYSMRFVDAIDA